MPDEPSADLLDRVRKLLAKAEGDGVTAHEAEALTAKAAELMARYGIDRARLAAARPETDRPADRVFDLDNPWASVKIYLLAQVASALRCVCVEVDRPQGRRLHVFGYGSDIERAAILYASLLVQMARGLAAEQVPVSGASARAWRRSWMLGYAGAAAARIRAAEDRAAQASGDAESAIVPSAYLVLASRAEVVSRLAEQAYPLTRETRVTFAGTGYSDGYREGGKADIGSATLAPRAPVGYPPRPISAAVPPLAGHPLLYGRKVRPGCLSGWSHGQPGWSWSRAALAIRSAVCWLSPAPWPAGCR